MQIRENANVEARVLNCIFKAINKGFHFKFKIYTYNIYQSGFFRFFSEKNFNQPLTSLLFIIFQVPYYNIEYNIYYYCSIYYYYFIDINLIYFQTN